MSMKNSLKRMVKEDRHKSGQAKSFLNHANAIKRKEGGYETFT